MSIIDLTVFREIGMCPYISDLILFMTTIFKSLKTKKGTIYF